MAKHSKHNLKWIKQTLELKENHLWTAKPGYQVFVADRGAVRFEVPQGWFLEPQTASFRFTDVEPPDDNCGLEVSFNRLPPADYSQLPLTDLLREVVDRDSRDVIKRGIIHRIDRVALRLVWTELRFIDPTEKREAFSRIAIGLGAGIQCLLTFEYWVEDANKFLHAWDTALETLKLGLYISDPTTGAARPD
jgi:hypothetical protein